MASIFPPFKIRFNYFLILFLGLVVGSYLNFRSPAKTSEAKMVTLQSRGFSFQVLTDSPSVGGLLAEQDIPLSGIQLSLPADTPIVSGMVIDYRVPVAVVVDDGGRITSSKTTALTVEDLINELQITLGPKDEVRPSLGSAVYEGMKVNITRVVEVEEEKTEVIEFAVIYQDDPNSLYGSQKILREGSVGEKRVLYSVRYRNGQEVGRKLLSFQTLKAPVAQIIQRGSKIVVETQEHGLASWYNYRGCLCAAHPYFPQGSYVRVTALATGNSIIVKINDRGPNQAVHPERILDLDAVAFKQLASLVTGTIEVKVEKLKTE